MKGESGIGFRIWTAALSLFVALMLFPNIVGRHGAIKAALITALAVGAIWTMYFVIGRLINGAVERELRRKKPEQDTKSRED